MVTSLLALSTVILIARPSEANQSNMSTVTMYIINKCYNLWAPFSFSDH